MRRLLVHTLPEFFRGIVQVSNLVRILDELPFLPSGLCADTFDRLPMAESEMLLAHPERVSGLAVWAHYVIPPGLPFEKAYAVKIGKLVINNRASDDVRLILSAGFACPPRLGLAAVEDRTNHRRAE
jgi:hypothetical protein